MLLHILSLCRCGWNTVLLAYWTRPSWCITEHRGTYPQQHSFHNSIFVSCHDMVNMCLKKFL